MKKSLKFLCLALTLLMVLPMTFGCFGKQGEDSEVETSGEAADATLTINGVAITDYTIVYSGKAETGGDKAATYLNSKLNELYGIALTSEHKRQQDRYEMLLGLDGGESALSAANKENSEGLIGASGKKIAIMGPNYAVLRQGIDAFLAKVTENGAQKEIAVSGNEFLNAKNFSVNVMTYNVLSDMGNGRGSDARARMVETILENNVDVLGTQEDSADNSEYFLENLENYDVYKGELDDGNYIYWRKDKFNVVKKSYLFLSDTPVTPSKFSGASANTTMSYVILEDKTTAKQFLLVNVQADEKANDKVRTQQMKVVAEQVEKINKNDLPVIVLGDLNTAATDILSQNKSFALSSKVAKSKGDSKGTLVNSFTERDATSVHDCIIVNTDSVCTDYYTVVNNIKDGKYPSDHLPVLATVKMY